jgi:hypothetical protein
VEKPDGSRWVEVFAGVPNKDSGKGKPVDGPLKEATFSDQFKGAVCNSRGTSYWLERPSHYDSPHLRRIESGTVSTVSLTRPDDKMLAGDCTLSLGENDDTIYIIDAHGHTPGGVLRCDLKTGVATLICGVNPRLPASDPRHQERIKLSNGGEMDGPARTHAGSSGGWNAGYDPFHNAIWLWGADTLRFRWLKLDGDGWVRTVFGALRPGTKPQPFGAKEINSLGVPGEQWRLYMSRNLAISPRGGVYFASGPGGDLTGIWYGYNKKAQARKEVRP